MIQQGDKFQAKRTFTHEDVFKFGDLTGDQGEQHTIPDEKGRLMVHGFLTASLATKLGGDFNFIGKEMTCTFIRPVYTGDTITCNMSVTTVEEQERYHCIDLFSTYHNQYGEDVIIGKSKGVILKK
ncbi:hotdog domain-containing protein [Bacillus sp. NPDC077027]|uniref:hotdog domain-containing protein n=1 Tax=Bacillus sp. NPDC077027 TaxID=3390548 RepID=UPI003D005052